MQSIGAATKANSNAAATGSILIAENKFLTQTNDGF